MISPLLAPKPAKITIPPFSRRNAATARYHLLPAESHRPFSNEAPRPNRANPERPGNRGSTPRPPAAVLIDLARRVPLFIPAGRGAIILNPRRPRPCAGSLARGQRYGRLTESGLASAAMTNPTENPAPFAGRDLACRRGERMVFARLDFLLEPGGLLVLRGANGSGKSSLLRLMAGLLRPVEGESGADRRRESRLLVRNRFRGARPCCFRHRAPRPTSGSSPLRGAAPALGSRPNLRQRGAALAVG